MQKNKKYYNPLWDKVHAHEWELPINYRNCAICTLCGYTKKANWVTIDEKTDELYWCLPIKGKNVKKAKNNI